MSKIFDGKLKRVGGVRHSEYSEYLERKKHGDFVVKGGVFTDSERAFYSKLELVTERFPLRPLVKVALKDIFDIKDSFLNHNQIHFDRDPKGVPEVLILKQIDIGLERKLSFEMERAKKRVKNRVNSVH